MKIEIGLGTLACTLVFQGTALAADVQFTIPKGWAIERLERAFGINRIDLIKKNKGRFITRHDDCSFYRRHNASRALAPNACVEKDQDGALRWKKGAKHWHKVLYLKAGARYTMTVPDSKVDLLQKAYGGNLKVASTASTAKVATLTFEPEPINAFVSNVPKNAPATIKSLDPVAIFMDQVSTRLATLEQTLASIKAAFPRSSSGSTVASVSGASLVSTSGADSFLRWMNNNIPYVLSGIVALVILLAILVIKRTRRHEQMFRAMDEELEAFERRARAEDSPPHPRPNTLSGLLQKVEEGANKTKAIEERIAILKEVLDASEQKREEDQRRYQALHRQMNDLLEQLRVGIAQEQSQNASSAQKRPMGRTDEMLAAATSVFKRPLEKS